MRVKYKNAYGGKSGYCAKIVGHHRNSLHLVMEEGINAGKEYVDLYWNWEPLDDEAKEYIAEVERTAPPLTTPLNDD